MKKLINFSTGFIAGLAPLFIAGIFSVMIYNELQNLTGIIICIILGLLAIWLGILIFMKILRIGIFDFMTVVVASPDLDNLEPTDDSKTKKRTPKELARLSHKNENLFKGGTIKIFGDWYGEPYHNFLKIISIDFNESDKQMIIQFSKKTRITIDEPGPVLESPSVLKILSAKKINLEFQHEKKNSAIKGEYFKTYVMTKNRIKTATNIDWTKQKSDAAIGQDALIIFN